MIVLITGVAGFIGFHLAIALNKLGVNIIGIDNINDYYDVSLKYSRLEKLGISKKNVKDSVEVIGTNGIEFIKADIQNISMLKQLLAKDSVDVVCHLAAQAGVRYSIDNPKTYIESNINGFLTILECCRNCGVKQLIYASSSSVYGKNTKIPFSEDDRVDTPASLYAATKRSDELLAYVYSSIFGIKTIGLRFFTVYGPWGRPDMAPMLFSKAIANREKIKVFNNGDMSRDFTYIDDIVDGLVKIIMNEDKVSYDKNVPYALYNIGNSKPVPLMEFINTLEREFNREVEKEFLPLQPGDVKDTWADVGKLIKDFDYSPNTPLAEGIHTFANWYKEYYKIK